MLILTRLSLKQLMIFMGFIMEYLLLLPILLPTISGIMQCFIDEKSIILRRMIILLTNLLILLFVTFTSFVKFDSLKLFDNYFILSCDGLGKFMAFFITFIYLLITIYLIKNLDEKLNYKKFYFFYYFIFSNLLAICYSINLLTIYIFMELVSISFLILILNLKKINNKIYLFIYLFIMIINLIGIIYVICNGGNFKFNYHDLSTFKLLNNVILFLIILSLFIQCLLFSISCLFSKTSTLFVTMLSSIIMFIIIRIIYFVVGTNIFINSYLQILFMILGLFVILISTILSLITKNFNNRLIYVTMIQLSYILCSIFLFFHDGFTTSLLMLLTFILSSVSNFLFLNIANKKINNLSIVSLNGYGKVFLFESISLTISCFSIIGLPFTLGFTSKWYLITYIMETFNPILAYIIIITIICTTLALALVLMFNLYQMFFATKRRFFKRNKHAINLMTTPLIILSILNVLFGIYIQPILVIIEAILPG